MKRRTENVAGGEAMIGERSDDVKLRLEMGFRNARQGPAA